MDPTPQPFTVSQSVHCVTIGVTGAKGREHQNLRLGEERRSVQTHSHKSLFFRLPSLHVDPAFYVETQVTEQDESFQIVRGNKSHLFFKKDTFHHVS